MEHSVPAAPLPEDVERAAGRLAALVLAEKPDLAAEVLGAMRDHEARRIEEGLPPSGLTDNASDLLNAMSEPPIYEELTRRMLEDNGLDPVLRRRLESYLARQPLRVAERRLREDRTAKLGAIFNRLVAPASRLFLGGVLPAFEAGRAALASLLVMHSTPVATTRERQALRAYQEFLARYPSSSERSWVEKRVRRFQRELNEQLYREAIETAERSLQARQPDAALLHLERAERLQPGRVGTVQLREQAREMRERRDRATRRSLGAAARVGVPLDLEAQVELEELCRAILQGPSDEIARSARAWQARHPNDRTADEMEFLQAWWYLARSDEDEFFRAMERLGRGDPRRASMARHARWIVRDPEQNPYAAYRAARRADRSRRIRWLFLGRRAHGALHRGLWRPLEWILDTPGFAVSLATMPLRLLQYPGARKSFGGEVLHAGERYVARFPNGPHAADLHRDLERRYAVRGNWGRALEHHQVLPEPDPARIARYRRLLADRILAAARLQRRLDVRAALYRSVIAEYGGTPAAQQAREEYRALIASASPQHIRLSRDFLLEHPELWEPRTLSLRPELLDGEKDNGEIAEEGLTLVGRNVIRIALEGREPVVKAVPHEHFANFIAALEEASYRDLMTDAREQPTPDPQRDLFFERARLGLLDSADVRPTARSEAEFLSLREKHGGLRRRESVLPVEVVVQGGLEDFGLAAFPRIRLPRETPDAFLYR
ncbi:MAG: hypothetical protein ACE5FG_01115 [Myxococcota bacterium]